MIFKTKLPDLDKFEDVVIGQELRYGRVGAGEIAQLRGYVGKKRRNAALTEVATKVSRRGTSSLLFLPLAICQKWSRRLGRILTRT